MPSGFSEVLANDILRQVLNNAPPRRYGEVWVGLLTQIPGLGSGELVEVSAPSYRRANGAWGAPKEGVSANADELVWPRALEDWGKIEGFAIYDAPTGGRWLMWSDWTNEAKDFDEGDRPVVLPGGVVIALPRG